MRPKRLAWTKTVIAKGRTYVYFDTGQKDARGKKVYARLPDPKDRTFGQAYAAMLGHRERRSAAEGVLTVKMLVELYQKSEHHRKLAKSSQRIYEIYQRYLVEQLPTAPAGLIERKDIIVLLDKRAATPGAANALLSAISALYAWGRDRGHVQNEPTKDIKPMGMGEHDPWPEHILEAALKAKDARIRLATHLLYYTAQRIGDVCTMRWSDIRDGVIFLRQQKTDVDLEIPVHASLATELAKHARTGMTILTSTGTRKLHPSTLRKALQAFGEERGVKVVPHGLRKNAVNALLEAGCTVAQTASISGQTLQTIEHYAKRRSQKKLSGSAVLLWEEQTRKIQTERKLAPKP